jgi:hypothetical protein
MSDPMRNFPSRGLGAALLALGMIGCAADDEPDLARDQMTVTVAEPEEEWRGAYVAAPEYTGAICQRAWPVASVEGPECTAREAFSCADGWTLQSRLEAIASGCDISPYEEAIEILLSDGCVTGMAVGPNSRANQPAIADCLTSALGSVQAACSEQPDCIRLFGGAAQPAW